MYDLILKGGHVIDPGQDLDGVLDVAFAEGLVAAVGPDLMSLGAVIRDVTSRFVTPGLIDMHSHVYWGATSLGVDAETIRGAVAPRPSWTPAVPEPATSQACRSSL